ncbi:MAG: polysaccharide pyruvyl transferase family protein [Ignavibacteriales bacterium]|nr:polysaccharide pyruvyl transferase family protein [Ignavibacteriales bacterium]
MIKLRICYYGSCWPTNIGNSFVNLGAIHSLKSAISGKGKVFHFGGMSSYLFTISGKSRNTLPIGEVFKCDYIVIGGMTMCEDNFKTQEIILKQFIKNNAKIIIAGGGAEKYDDKEVKAVRKWMKKIPIYGFISRDEYTYKKYADLAIHSFNGVDSAMFISDFYKPPKLNLSTFAIFNFDKLPEPRVRADVKLIFRTHHSCWPPNFKKEYFDSPNTLISDLPSDYLNLYANTKITYSDRVHACLATLAYGNEAMFFGKNSPRILMFQRIGAAKIIDQPVKLDIKTLSKEKKMQINFLKEILI